jgi:asparagine synthase (glutamine-hydrolysing)
VLEENILSERALGRGVFNPSYVRELVDRHTAGENHAERLWMLLNFEIWQRRFFDGETSSVDAQPSMVMKASPSSAGV